MKVAVNRSKCIAAGQCVLKSPRVFDQDEDDGIVVLLTENPSSEDVEATKVAARVCPAGAIQIIEE
jgi:ferredoxin